MTLHPDGETIALDPIPAADNPLVRNARVAADVLFCDPPGAYAVNITEYDVTMQGLTRDGIEEWALRHYLTFDDAHRHDDGNLYREYVGTIEGVPFRAVGVTR